MTFRPARHAAFIAALMLATVVFGTPPVNAHPAYPPGSGGWVPHSYRPDGLPITHYCGEVTFAINDRGNTALGQHMRDIIYGVYLETGQDFREVAPNAQNTAARINLDWSWPPDGPDAAAWTSPGSHDGWNWTRRVIRFNPPNIHFSNLTWIIRHELGHAFGMAHTPYSVQSVMGQQYSDYTAVDRLALDYLLGHPAVPGEPCWRAWW